MRLTFIKSFSLSTLLLLVVIAALSFSQIVLIWQLSSARSEVQEIRRKFGYIRVTDRTKTYVAQIAENEANGDAYRIWIPKGRRYVLHLTDGIFETTDRPTNPIPTKSYAMNDWAEGADTTLSCSIYWENKTNRVLVHSKTDELFDYSMPDWQAGSGPSELTWFQPYGQSEYTADQTIQFMLWRNTNNKRGILLWMEPMEQFEKRKREEAKRTTGAE
jgi:hypothetical protein